MKIKIIVSTIILISALCALACGVFSGTDTPAPIGGTIVTSDFRFTLTSCKRISFGEEYEVVCTLRIKRRTSLDEGETPEEILGFFEYREFKKDKYEHHNLSITAPRTTKPVFTILRMTVANNTSVQNLGIRVNGTVYQWTTWSDD